MDSQSIVLEANAEEGNEDNDDDDDDDFSL